MAQEVSDKESCCFQFADSDALVRMGSQLVTLNTLITEKQRTKFDEAVVRYHEMTPSPRPGLPTHFTLKCVQQCFFQIEPFKVQQEGSDQEFKVEFCHLGSALPQKVWDSSEILLVTWHVKWTIKGLSPIRPLIVLREAVSIPAESAILVACADSAAANHFSGEATAT